MPFHAPYQIKQTLTLTKMFMSQFYNRLRFLIFHSFHSSAFKITKDAGIEKANTHENLICPSNFALIVLWFLIFTILIHAVRWRFLIWIFLFSFFQRCPPNHKTRIQFDFLFLSNSPLSPKTVLWTRFLSFWFYFFVNILSLIIPSFRLFLHLDLHFVLVFYHTNMNWFVENFTFMLIGVAGGNLLLLITRPGIKFSLKHFVLP